MAAVRIKEEDRRDIEQIMETALETIKEVLLDGAQKGKDSFRTEDADFHFERALSHIRLHRAGDTSDSHLPHALTRLAMAAAIEARKSESAEMVDAPAGATA